MIKLYNGDCLTILSTMEPNMVDAIIADIPYFVTKFSFDKQWKSEREYLLWCEMIIKELSRVLKPSGSLMLFTGRQYNRKICNVLDEYFKEQRIIIWYRKRFNTTRGKSLASSYEPICYYTKGTPVFNNIKIKTTNKRREYMHGTLQEGVSLSDVWIDIPALPHNSKEKVSHPTQKPIKLMERCIEICTRPNDIVLDFTMGSGTTGVACKRLNRNFIGIEKEKEYFETAKARIEKEKTESLF